MRPLKEAYFDLYTAGSYLVGSQVTSDISVYVETVATTKTTIR
jgi:hypothetical protein